MRLLPFLCLLCFPLLAPGAGKEIEGERKAAQTACPTPEEARAKMSVPEGYEVRCFAHEPMVQNPVAMTWDHRGRLWVVEAYEYPEGSNLPAPFGGEAKDDQYHPLPKTGDAIPRDRVIILEDTDNDGVADKRTVFVQGLDMGSAILCGDGGIYVGQQPHLIHFRDDDGDDKPDAWRVVLTGFGREDTHELVNSFTWGPDGWLYMTHGVFTNSKVRRPGQPESEGFKFDAGIGRARPVGQASSLSPSVSGILPEDGKPGKMPGSPEAGKMPAPQWEFEVFADGTSNPWGCDYDAAGNFFVSACVIDHFFHMAPGGIYVRQGGAPENPYSYELLPSIVKHKHFRAAYAGVQIYQGGRYPADTHGHAFIGNIHDNAIHEEVLTPVGATFKCEPRRDFLRANDGWFRPVSTQTGPDGFLWIMDWCDKYPCYQNAKANPEGVDRERGRIWRVVFDGKAGVEASADPKPSTPPTASPSPKGSTPTRPTNDLDLKKLATADLVKTLEHPNNWMRRMARRMLVEQKKFSADTLEALLKSAYFTKNLEAFWALENIDRNTDRLRAADSSNSALRTWFVRAMGEIGGEMTGVDLFPQLAKDAEPQVRTALALALRQHSGVSLTATRARKPIGLPPHGKEALEALMSVSKDSQAPLPFHIWMALEPTLGERPTFVIEMLVRTAPTTQPLSRVLSHKAMRRLCDTRKAENLDLAVEFCDKIAAHDILLAHALDGLVKGQEGGVIKPVNDVSASLAKWRSSANADVRKHAQTLAVLWGDEVAVKEMIVALHDASKPEKDRIAVLQSLRKVKTDAVKEGLKPLLAPGTSTTLGVAAIRAAADLGGDDFVLPLISQAASKDFTPTFQKSGRVSQDGVAE